LLTFFYSLELSLSFFFNPGSLMLCGARFFFFRDIMAEWAGLKGSENQSL